MTAISSTAWGFDSFLQLHISPSNPPATKNRINIKQQQWSTRLITPIKYRECIKSYIYLKHPQTQLLDLCMLCVLNKNGGGSSSMCRFDLANPKRPSETPSAGPKIQVQNVVQRSWWRDGAGFFHPWKTWSHVNICKNVSFFRPFFESTWGCSSHSKRMAMKKNEHAVRPFRCSQFLS